MSAPTPAPSGLRVNVSLPALIGVGALLLIGGLGAAWHLRMQAINEEIEQTRQRLKSLHLGGRLLPSQSVMDYLQTRDGELDQQYHAALKLMTVSPAVADGHEDQQLYFQQRVHEVQNTLSRLAAARKLTTPSLLGLPKELPPPDVAPRFLLQLSLAQQVAEDLMPNPDVTGVVSLKVEDPEPIAAADDAEQVFLTRLPVRLRATASLKGVATILATLDRLRPAVDIAALRVSSPKDAGVAADAEASSPARPTLEIDCIVARYVLNKAEPSANATSAGAGKAAAKDDGP